MMSAAHSVCGQQKRSGGVRHWAAFLLLMLSMACGATTSDQLQDPLAARINGDVVSLDALRVLHRVAAGKDIRMPMSKVLASVIDNRLLADHASRQFSDAQLFPNTGVAFRRAVAVEDQLVATLRRAYVVSIDQALDSKGGLDQFITKRYALERGQLASLLGNDKPLRLNNTITPQQESTLQQQVLLDYRFAAGAEGRITLGDVWQRQNVQGRNSLFANDVDYAHQQAKQLLASRYVLFWAEHDGGLSGETLRQISQAISDRDRRGALLQQLGIEADMHYDSAYLKQLAASVTPAEITDYYSRNKAEFKRIDKVHAHHLHCDDEACAQRISARLAKQDSVNDVAKLTAGGSSLAMDDMGWITEAQASRDWLAQVAFALPVGTPSKPIRQPQFRNAAPGWEIVLVDEKVESYHPANSETVRYIASQSIARKKAVTLFKQLREQLYRDANIEINGKAIGLQAKDLSSALADKPKVSP